jgi:hypothetical protein
MAAALIGGIASLAICALAAKCWERRRGAGDVLFGDLMIWGWARRWRAEKRLDSAVATLGLAHPAGASDPASVTADRRARLLEQLAHDLEIGDPYTHGHSRRVARYSAQIATRMGLDASEVARVRTAAALHDVGERALAWRAGGTAGSTAQAAQVASVLAGSAGRSSTPSALRDRPHRLVQPGSHTLGREGSKRDAGDPGHRRVRSRFGRRNDRGGCWRRLGIRRIRPFPLTPRTGTASTVTATGSTVAPVAPPPAPTSTPGVGVGVSAGGATPVAINVPSGPVAVSPSSSGVGVRITVPGVVSVGAHL